MFIPKKYKAVHFAVRINVIAKYLGQVMTAFAALNGVPLLVSLAWGRYDVSLRYGIIILILLLVGVPFARMRAGGDLQRNEALAISGLAFFLPPFLLALPLMGYGLDYGDAVFEAVSGITTTGLSAVASVENMPFPFHFARAWMQWVGGLGVVILSVAFLLEAGTATKHLGFDRREVDDLVGGMRTHARKVLVTYSAVTAGGVALLLVSGMSAEDAVLHALAAVSTGGFSNHDDSLAALPFFASRATVIALCFAGAVPFYLYYSGGPRRWRRLFADIQLRGLVIIATTITLLVFGLMWASNPGSPIVSLKAAALTAISAQTTAGFSVVPFHSLNDAVVAVLIAAMIVGGGFGSTAGGIKVLRLIILMRLLQLLVLRSSISKAAHISRSLGGKALNQLEVEAAMAVIFGYVGVVFLSFVVFLAYGQPPMASLFEVVSAVGTVGLSSGLSGPHLAGPLKVVLCIDMLMGRVEMIAFIVLLFPGTWIGRRRKS